MGLTVELLTNLFQSVMYTGFLYLFFDKPQGKAKRILPFAGCVTVFFLITTFFTFNGNFTGASSYYLDSVLYIAVMVLYSLIFLKGKLYLRIAIPLIAFGINALISYSFGYLVSFISGIPIEESLVMSTGFRYLCLIAVNLTTALLLWIILRIGADRIRLSGWAETITFAVIPCMCTIILYCNFFIFNVSGFDVDLLPFLLTICIIMVGISILICVMLVRISKANRIKTELLLSRQQEMLYEKSIIATNTQIEKISGIKHDMKNKLKSIEGLIEQGKTEEALRLCDDAYRTLESTYTPINSGNPVLNAIINVELEKAASEGIQFNVDISNSMSNISSDDLVSLIGNLCDNAIEYLSEQAQSVKEMSLRIYSQLNFDVIICKNKVGTSVLAENPELNTTKSDSENHGKGISMVRRIAKEYDGDVLFSEENGYITVSVMINN